MSNHDKAATSFGPALARRIAREVRAGKRNGENNGSAGRIIRMCVVLAAIHSALASKQAKDLVCRLAGPRHRNGLYRPFFVVKSVVMFGWATLWFFRQPDRELYQLRAPWSWVLRVVQVASLAMLFSAVRVVTFRRFLGVDQLWNWLAGRTSEPEPEAQGPPLGDDGELVARGPFQITRHPDNLPVLGLLWCFPRMTVNRAAVAAALSLYAIIGSIHEDFRLRAAYGAAYSRYQRRVPFMLPRLRR